MQLLEAQLKGTIKDGDQDLQVIRIRWRDKNEDRQYTFYRDQYNNWYNRPTVNEKYRIPEAYQNELNEQVEI